MERTPVLSPRIKNLKFKVGLLLVMIPLIGVALVVYALYARGLFEPWRKVALIASNADGASVGMPVTVSGFPVGNVTAMGLTEKGEVRIEIRIREKDAQWLRSSSAFTLERPILGTANIRATSPNMKDPPLPEGAVRELVATDATADIPQVIARANSILENIDRLTNADSSVTRSLANLQAVTGRMAGDYGLMEGLTGSPERARQVMDSVKQVDTLIASLNAVSVRMERVLARTDERVFGKDGVMDETQKAVAQLNSVLGDARNSLQKADAMLATAQAAAANAKDATADIKGASADLVALRAEVDTSIRKVNHLLNEINRRWPFAKDTRIKLP